MILTGDGRSHPWREIVDYVLIPVLEVGKVEIIVEVRSSPLSTAIQKAPQKSQLATTMMATIAIEKSRDDSSTIGPHMYSWSSPLSNRHHIGVLLFGTIGVVTQSVSLRTIIYLKEVCKHNERLSKSPPRKSRRLSDMAGGQWSSSHQVIKHNRRKQGGSLLANLGSLW